MHGSAAFVDCVCVYPNLVLFQSSSFSVESVFPPFCDVLVGLWHLLYSWKCSINFQQSHFHPNFQIIYQFEMHLKLVFQFLSFFLDLNHVISCQCFCFYHTLLSSLLSQEDDQSPSMELFTFWSQMWTILLSWWSLLWSFTFTLVMEQNRL